ncbi:MAG: ribosome biogenesis GTPase Der, partial [Fibrobacter sp.]|nr:ribosome biogenesis GTPase Der [Fibrobacter sp.]
MVGRPNVGKSSLFNRIIGKKVAVIDDMPGVTRDRNYYNSSWNGMNFMLVDTGGMLPTVKEAIPEAIHEQVRIAVNESEVVIFVTDGGTGPTDFDEMIAKQLKREAADKVIVAVNKTEAREVRYESDAFRSLGLGKPFAISALHGNGVADFLDEMISLLRYRLRGKDISETPDDENELKLAVVGRPNAGKSSLVNKLLNQSRMIVDSVPGTTRDAIDSKLDYKDKKIVLIDTAGLRKRSHIKLDLEYYSNLRAISSIERSDVCFLVIDVTHGIGVQDLRILRKIFEMHKGVVIVWNKWDIMSKDHKTFDQLVAETRKQYIETRFIPMVSISALTGQRVNAILDLAMEVKERMVQRVPASEFENKLFSWTRVHPHPAIPEKPVRFLGAKQVSAPFPLFRGFVTNPDSVAVSYTRYLINKIYETYDFRGCPVVMDFRPIA